MRYFAGFLQWLIRKFAGRYFSEKQWANIVMKEIIYFSGDLYNDPDFRKTAGFNDLEEKEHDRIFNEIQAAGLILAAESIKLEAQRLGDEREEFWRRACKLIPEEFFDWLSELKIEKENVDIWKKLYKLRLEEYRKGADEIKTLMKKELPSGHEKAKEVYFLMESIAISSTLHIKRGVMEPGDRVKRYLMTWLGILHEKTTKAIR
jgi:hypothetical protein